MIESFKCSPASPRVLIVKVDHDPLVFFFMNAHEHGSPPGHDHVFSDARTTITVVLPVTNTSFEHDGFSTHEHNFSPNTSHEHCPSYFPCQIRAISLKCHAIWFHPLSFCLYPLERGGELS